MAAIQVTSTNNSYLDTGGRQLFRDSDGIPYVLVDSLSDIELWRGREGSHHTNTTNYNLDDSTTAVSQSFTGTGGDISSVSFKLDPIGSPTGNAYAKIYAHSGTLGLTSVPTGAALATSDAFDVSSISVSQFYEFTFSTPFTTTDGTNYCVAIEYTNGTSSNFVIVRATINTNNAHYGNASSYVSSWSSGSTDLLFYLECTIPKFIEIATYTGGTSVYGISGAIDENDVLHVSWMDDQGKASTLEYTTCDLTQESVAFATETVLISDIGEDPAGGSLYTATAIDQNGVPHIAYNEYIKIGGTATYVCYYINKVGGSWNTEVAINSTQGEHCYYIDIAIGLDNKPHIAYCVNEVGNYKVEAAIGNANNATSFTIDDVRTSHATDRVTESSIAINFNGNVTVAWVSTTGDDLQSVRHIYGDSWTTWDTQIDGPSDVVYASIVAYNENKIYCFYCDTSWDIVFTELDYADSTPDWSTATSLETGTYMSVEAKWAFISQNDSSGLIRKIWNATSSSGVSVYGGDGVQERVGQKVSSIPVSEFRRIRVHARQYGTPTDNVVCKVYSGGWDNTLVATSNERSAAVGATVDWVSFEFADTISVTKGNTYYFVFERTGSRDQDNTFGLYVTATNNYTDLVYAIHSTVTWTENTNGYEIPMLIERSDLAELDYAMVDSTAQPHTVYWDTFLFPKEYTLTADYGSFALTGHWRTRQTQIIEGATGGINLVNPSGLSTNAFDLAGDTSTISYRKLGWVIDTSGMQYDVKGKSLNFVEFRIEKYAAPSENCYVEALYGSTNQVNDATSIGNSSSVAETSFSSGDVVRFTFSNKSIPSTLPNYLFFMLRRDALDDSNMIRVVGIQSIDENHYSHLELAIVTPSGGDAAFAYNIIGGISFLEADGGYTLTAASASFALTGFATTLKKALRMVASHGAFALTGQEIQYHLGKRMIATHGSFALTGYAAELHRGIQMTAASGSFTLTGYATNLGIGYTLTAAHGSFTLTGQNVTFLKPNNYTLTAEVGTYASRGHWYGIQTMLKRHPKDFNIQYHTDDSIDHCDLVGPATTKIGTYRKIGASLTASGNYWNTVNVESISFRIYDITGSPTSTLSCKIYYGIDIKNATLLKTSENTIGESGLSVGDIITFTFPNDFVLPAFTNIQIMLERADTDEDNYFAITTFVYNSSYNNTQIYTHGLTYADVKFNNNRDPVVDIRFRMPVMVASHGAFTLSGQAVAFNRNITLSAAYGGFALTGFAAELSAVTGYTLTAEMGAFSLTGYAVNLTKQLTLDATPQTDFTLTGFAVNLHKGLTLDATPQTDFTLTGFATGLTKQLRMGVTHGSFSLTGYTTELTKQLQLQAVFGGFTLTGNGVNFLLGKKLSAQHGNYGLTGYAVQFKRNIILSAAHGSFSLTGYAADLLAGAILTAEVGTFSLTGYAAQVNVGRTLSAAHGSFTLTGYAANLLGGNTLAAETGTFSLTGYASELNIGRVFSAEYGAFTLTGQAAQVNVGRTLSASHGAFALTGYATILHASRQITANTGVFAFSYQATDLLKGLTLTADGGTFALTGFSAGLLTQGALFASTGYFSLTGFAAQLKKSLSIQATYAAFTLTGQAAGLNVGVNVLAEHGAFALTGFAATLTYTPGTQHYTLTADGGTFALTGQSANLTLGWTMTVDSAEFTLTGYEAGLLTGAVLQAATGTFTLTGQAVQFRKALSLTAQSVNFSLTGYSVGLLSGKHLAAEFGAFTLSGQAVTLTRALTMPATTGEYALTGFEANLIWSVIILYAETGYFGLTGFPAGGTLRTLGEILTGNSTVTLELSRDSEVTVETSRNSEVTIELNGNSKII